MTACKKGFTLIEIMVSLAVLAIVLTTIFKLQSSTIALAEAGHFKSSAPMLARQQLAELAQNNFEPEQFEGKFEKEFTGYSWACEIQTGADQGNWEAVLSGKQPEQLKKICLTVYGPGRIRRFTLETWRFVIDE